QQGDSQGTRSSAVPLPRQRSVLEEAGLIEFDYRVELARAITRRSFAGRPPAALVAAGGLRSLARYRRSGAGWLLVRVRRGKLAFMKVLGGLLIGVPVAVALDGLRAGPGWVFAASVAAIIPLAGWITLATEDLSRRVGAVGGSLLNATLSNAAELIIALFAL